MRNGYAKQAYILIGVSFVHFNTLKRTFLMSLWIFFLYFLSRHHNSCHCPVNSQNEALKIKNLKTDHQHRVFIALTGTAKLHLTQPQ